MAAQFVGDPMRPGPRRRLRAVVVAAGVIVLGALVLAGCAAGSGTQRSGTQRSGVQRSAVVPAAARTSPAPLSSSSSSRAGQAVATSKPGTSPRTTVRRFVPYTSSGAPVAGVTARRSGSCFTASVVVSRPNAYRCLAGNALLDPCFATSRSSTILACFSAPWSTVTRLRLTKPLASSVANPNPTHVNMPWALQLSGGVRCVAGSGTATVKQGVAMTYACAGGGTAGLVRSVRAQRGPVRALYAPSGKTARRVPVSVEWVTSS